jgi:hypothetical protein
MHCLELISMLLDEFGSPPHQPGHVVQGAEPILHGPRDSARTERLKPNTMRRIESLHGVSQSEVALLNQIVDVDMTWER